jgi:PAS domain S-box-containing protein
VKDSDPSRGKMAKSRLLPLLAMTFTVVAVSLLAFELAKNSIHPQVTLWESHIVTILFGAVAATGATALIFRSYHLLLQQSREEIAERQRTEHALATERNRLRVVIDTVPDQIYVKDSQGRFLAANDSLARALGVTRPEEVLGKTDRDFFSADLASQYAADEERVLQSGEPLVNREELALDLPTAAPTWHLTTKVPLRSQEGAIVGTVGVSRDISARKQNEEALRIRTQQLEAVRAVSEEITRELDLVALLDLILQRAVNLAGASGGTILFWDEARQVLVPQVHSAIFDPLGWQNIPVGRGVVGRVAATRAGIVVNDYQSWDGAISTALTQTGVTASMAEPLLCRDILVGVINVVHTEDRSGFTDRDGQILRLLAAQAAIAIENARLFTAAQRSAREAHSLFEVAHSLTTSLDPQEVLHLITVKTTDLLGTPHAQVVLSDEDGTTLRLGAAYGTEADQVQRQEFRLGNGINGIVAQTRQPLIVNDYQAFPHRVEELTGVVAGIGVPLLYRNRLLGVLTSHSTQPGWVFTREHLALLTSFADQAAVALENARLYHQAQERQQQLEAVRTISTEITRELNLAAVLHLIARRLSELMGRGAVWLWDDAGKMLAPHTSTGAEAWQQQPLKLGEGLVGIVAERREGMIVNEYRSWPLARPTTLERSKITAVVAEPLVYRDRLVGVISLDNGDTARPFSEQDREILHLFGIQAAIAIENARLFEATRRRAEQLGTLNDITRALTTLDPQQVAEQTLRAVQILMPEVAARFWEHGPEEGVFRHVASVGMRDRSSVSTVRFPPGEGLLGLTLSMRQPVISRDVNQDPRFRERARAKTEGVVSCAMLPLLAADRVCGILAIFTRTPHDFPEEEVSLLRSFAAQAAVAIENARLFAELKRAYEDLRLAQDELVRSEKLRALGQMGAGIAHDLNNVLASIIGQVELLRIRVADPEVRETLLVLETAAVDGAEVVRRLQDFARPRGASPLVALGLPRVVLEALEITRPRWKDEPERRGVHIEVRNALADLPPILGHAPELREALTNLIFNAVDAMPQGGILTLTGSASSVEVSLAITDTGVGMTEEVRTHIFEPFFTTKGPQGTGLGLAVVYGIMERHGGRVGVASALGQGTTVTLTFQVACGAEAASEPPGLTPVIPRRILLIEDDPMVRQTLAVLLQEAGHSVVVADGGVAGLARLAETPVDCVLTDLGMPELTGWDVAREVRARCPHLPIVLLTGWGEQVAGEAGHQGLVDRILGKPVRLEELLRVIRQVTESPSA